MKRLKLIISILLICLTAPCVSSQGKKVIKGFFGGDNPYGLDFNSATFGMGGCAKLHFTEHFRAGFEGYFSSAPIRKGVQSGSHNKMFWTGALADWLIAINSDGLNRPHGPRIYFGVIFAH